MVIVPGAASEYDPGSVVIFVTEPDVDAPVSETLVAPVSVLDGIADLTALAVELPR